MAKSAPARAPRGGGVPAVPTQYPRHWLGGPCTKGCSGLNQRTMSTIRKKRPPPPPATTPLPKKWHSGRGGQNEKIHRGIILSAKMMIVQGVDIQNHPWGYAKDPKKGGLRRPSPALDLTTALRGDWPQPPILKRWESFEAGQVR